MKKGKYLSQREVMERGWTKAMITKLLGDPDQLKANPMYKAAAPMRLYSVKRVIKTEGGQEYTTLRAKADKRRDAMRPSIEQRRSDTLAEVKNVHVRIKKLSLEHYQREAVESYNELHDPFDPVDLKDVKERNPDFLDRITVNHIRHNRTCYDEKLVEQAGKIGVNAAQEIVRAKVYKAIMDTYPQLTEECQRQLDDRECDIALAA